MLKSISKIGNVWWEKARKEAEKQTGLDDSDVAKSFNPNEFIEQYKIKDSPFGAQQGQLAQALMASAMGRAPSLADAVAQQQMAQGMNAISAQTASARGVNPALAARGAQQAAASLQGQLAQQRIQGQLAEQMQAQQALGQVLAQARMQDQNLQKMQLDQIMFGNEARLQEALQRQQLNAQGRVASRGNRFQNWQEQQETGRQILGAIGGGMAASDERVKTDINEVSKEDVKEFLSAIKPKSYKYKDTSKPGTSEGERVGFMLQDVQNTKLGKKITRRAPDGTLMYDRDNLHGIILAALAHSVK